MEYLSGATGYTILSKNNKDILLLADIHDGVNYCSRNQPHVKIRDFLKNKKNNFQILLEESINDPDLNLTDLWPNAEHTRQLKILKENDKNIIPTDIRPYLIPFSWQLAESSENSEYTSANQKYKELLINKYLFYFSEFFKHRGKTFERFILPYYEFIEKDDMRILINIFETIKNLFIKLSKKYENLTLNQILKKDEDYMHSIDNINSLIMEYYILLLIFSNKKDSIIHTGLAHSTRIKSILVDEFKFKIVEDVSMTQIENYTGSDNTNACILNPSKSEFFNKKKSMYR
jgi:hypothetical protein